ncbi:protein patched homolog 1-like isoform X2 [Dysidea avara]|uniref:protein patched homolog 1-like isoform X2 n=1 Tax=Dysidea avara TaxID=196820 RepID=UPI003323BB1E
MTYYYVSRKNWNHNSIPEKSHTRKMTYTFRDLCAYVPYPPTGMPDFDRILNELHTCGMFTIVDCYWEGSLLQNPPESVVVPRPTYCPEMPENLTWSNFNYTQLTECMRNNPNESNYNPQVIQGFLGLGIDGYVGRDCFYSQGCPESSRYVEANSNLFRNVDACKGASNAAVTPHAIVTGYQGNDNGTDQLRTFRTDLLLGGTDLVRNNLLFHGINISRIDTLGLLERWKELFYDHVVDYDEGRIIPRSNRTSRDQMYGFSSITVPEFVEELSVVVPALLATGYVLMVLYCAAAFFKCDSMQSRCGVGLMGVFIVILGSAAALGITAWAGLKFTGFTTQIYPFLVLGLGVDDMFVIVGTFLEIEQRKGRSTSIKELIKDTMVIVGPSITLTSVTNFAGFLMCYIIPFITLRGFVVEVAVAITLNYIGLVIGMPCYLIIDYYRSHGKLLDVLCCIPVFWRKNEDDDTSKEVDEKKEEPGKSGVMASASSWLSQANKEYNSILTWFVVKYYSPFLQNYIVKAVAIVAFFIILAVGIWGCTRIKYDRHLGDISTNDRFTDYAKIDDEYFQTYAFIVATKDINYPGLQPRLLEMERRVVNSVNVIAPTSTNRLWLRVMIEYFQSLHARACQLNITAFQNTLTLIIPALDQTYLPNEPSCVRATNVTTYSQECLCNYNLFAVEEFRGMEFTVIPPDRFYYYLTIWATLDRTNFQLLRAFLSPAPLLTDFTVVVPSEPLLYAQVNLYVDDLTSADLVVDHLESVKDILDDLEIDGYNFGTAVLLYAQFLTLSRDTLLGAAIIVICCFLVTSVFLMDLHSGIVMGTILIVNAVEIFGFIGVFEIDVNFFPATVFLAGIALCVEFTAPLVFYFLKATATGTEGPKHLWLRNHNERMHKALEHRFTPIFNGAVTTFVGVIMLLFAPVRFIQLYFFAVYMIIIVLGVLNGLLFLPVLLSVVGPFAQVWPVNTAPPQRDIQMGYSNPIGTEDMKEEELKKEELKESMLY